MSTGLVVDASGLFDLINGQTIYGPPLWEVDSSLGVRTPPP